MSEPPPSSAVAEESYVDVLIIGAGPAGVMCANALVHAGVKVRVVDVKSVSLFCISYSSANGFNALSQGFCTCSRPSRWLPSTYFGDIAGTYKTCV